jgi:polyisoprenoid-binding protein YceI
VAATLKIDPKAPAGPAWTPPSRRLHRHVQPALDTHLKSPDFLDVAKFPTATFKATAVKPTGERTADVTGDLTLHGVTKPVTFQATFTRGGMNPVDRNSYRLGFQGKTVIKRSDWGIKAYVPAISDEVTLEIDAEFKAAA